MSRRRAAAVTLRFGTPIVLVVLWWVLSADSQSLYFPPLSKIVSGFFDTWNGDHLRTDLWPSLERFIIGFAVSVIVGVALGVALGLSPRVRRDFFPLLEFGRSMPVAAVIPIPLLIIGPGAKMDVLLIVFACIFPILVATADGVRGVDPVTVQTAQVYGLNRRQVLREVVLPAAMPQVFSGLRIALSIGIAATVIVGMIGTGQGLGAFVIQAQQSFAILDTWSGLIMIGLLGVVFNALFLLVQRRALAWHRGWRSATVAAH